MKTKKMLLATFLFCLSIINLFAQVNTASGLVGYWPFNGNANDYSGYGNNGVVKRAALTTDRFGEINRAFSFNDSSYIEVPDNPVLNFDTTTSFSICCWFQMDSAQNVWPALISKGTVESPIYQLAINRYTSNTPAIAFEFYNPIAVGLTIFGDKIPMDNNWHFATAIVNRSSKSLQLYLDNELNYEYVNDTVDRLNLSSTATLKFGVERLFSYYFQGRIDDIRIYDRAISSQEVQALYNETETPITEPDTMRIGFNKAHLVLDGLDNDTVWQGISETPILKVAEGTISGPEDLSATMKSYWNYDSLYFLIKVKDNHLYSGPGPDWETDYAEIYLDMNNSRGTSYDSDDREIRFNWNQGWTTGTNVPQGINFVIHTNAFYNGYSLEIAMPLANIGVPYMGVFGFDVQVGDNDGTPIRHAVISWHSDTTVNWYNPSVNGEAKLSNFSILKKSLSTEDIIVPDCGTDTSSIVAKIYNFGLNPVDTFNIGYELDGKPITPVETVYHTIVPGNSYAYRFKTKANFSYDGDYSVKVTTLLPGDDWLTNIPLTKSFFIHGTSNNYPGWSIFSTCNGLPGNVVRYIMKDSKDNMWAGTQNNGVAKMDPSGKWSSFDTKDGLSYNNVNSLMEDKDGNIWACLDMDLGIVAKYDGTLWSNPNTSIIHILSAFQDSKGYIWFGTWGNGVKIYDIAKNTITSFTHQNSGLAGDIVWIGAVMEDKNKNIWVATCNDDGNYGGTGGLCKFDGINWNVFTSSNSGLPINDIICAFLDTKGNIWLGYGWYGNPNKGVTKYDGKYWTTYNTFNSDIASNRIYNIFEDSHGNIWFGSDDQGASKFDGTNWTSYNVSNSGIISNAINSIAEDANGNMWFATSKGISVLSVNPVNVINKTELFQNSLNAFPNPFSNYVSIEYSLSKVSDFELAAYDLEGRKLTTITKAILPAGTHNASWNTDGIAAGVYYLQMRTSDGIITTKMIVKY